MEVPSDFFLDEKVVVGFKFPNAFTPKQSGVNAYVRILAVRFANIGLHGGREC